jgi:alanine racemase
MRSTFAKIHTSCLKYNYLNIRKKVKNSKVMTVVKADAYGHGMYECVKALASLGKKRPEYYGVALTEEGIELRKSKLINEPIVCFNPFDRKDLGEYLKYKLMPTICTEKHINQLYRINLGSILKLHINVDTGMGRLGLDHDKAVKLIIKITKIPKIKIDGIYTHFATSDEKDKTFAKLQLDRFNSVINQLKELDIDYGLVHAANSGAILDMPNAYFDMVRPGISLYGYYPSLETTESIKLKPVMSLVSKVSSIRSVKKGESVSYGRKYFAKKNTKMISVPIGYADGFVRALTNKTDCILKGKKYKQAGRVTMDRVMYDIGNDDIKVGDEVILIGQKAKQSITAWDWAKELDSIPYEITCNISKRVPRIYVN